MIRKNIIASLLVAFILIGFNSCKKETIDVTQLLTTVPSSAAGIIVLNLEDMLEDAGCKFKDNKVIPGKDVQALLEKSDASLQKNLTMFFDNTAGIDQKCALVFYDSNRAYLTFALNDVAAFYKFIEGRDGAQFTDEGSGVKLCGRTAVKGSQAWVCISPHRRVDPDAIAAYATLNDSQSFLVTPMGERLLVEENDIRGWALIDTFIDDVLSRDQTRMMTLGLGILFEDASSVKFKLDFDKGEIEAEAVLLNEKLKPAKFQLSSDKLDVATLKTLGTTCEAMMAFTVNSKLIKKFDQIGESFGGALFGNLGQTLKNIDGTVGLVSSGSGLSESLNGVVTTKGEVSKVLKDMISNQIAPVSEDGKYLRFSKGDVKGDLNVEQCAEDLKGACMGWVAAPGALSMFGASKIPQGFDYAVVKLEPESGGLELEVKLKGSDPKENSLITILNNM